MDTDVKLEQEIAKVEDYFVDDLDELIANENNKQFNNRCKALATLMEAQNQSEQIKLDQKKTNWEIDKEKKQLELDERRVVNEEIIAKGTVKDQKKTWWLNLVKTVFYAIGIIAGIFLTIWTTNSSMMFEETGSFRASVSKFAQQFVSKQLSKFDKAPN